MTGLLTDLLARSARRDPDAVAVVDRDRRCTYGELASRAGRIANLLRSLGVGPGDVFGREQKYDGSADFTVPARISAEEHARLEQAARTLYDVLGCAGVARFDFFVTPTGVVLNEVNMAPGFTEQSQVPRMFAATGMSYVDLVAALLATTGRARAMTTW